jgi:hypothetical protein
MDDVSEPLPAIRDAGEKKEGGEEDGVHCDRVQYRCLESMRRPPQGV